MADDPTKPDPTAGDPPKTDPPSGDPPNGDDFDKERAMNTIRAQREELKSVRDQMTREMDELKAELKKRDDEKLSETEKRENRIKELESESSEAAQKLRAQDLRLGVYSLSKDLAIADVDLAIAALDTTKVKWGDSGKPENLKELVEALLEEKPILKASEDPDPKKKKTAGTNAGEGDGSKPPALTAEELAWCQQTGTTPEEYARKKSISSVADYLASVKAKAST